jgi:ElaB/YqjD/DUF883 family membrane-anchored ribosome-binding protein
MSFTKNSLSSNDIATKLMDSADHALAATQHAAHDLVQSGVDGLRKSTDQASRVMQHAGNTAQNYVKDEPVKAILIAAATGAALMALISLISHSRQRS